jgi:hypothetical protein
MESVLTMSNLKISPRPVELSKDHPLAIIASGSEKAQLPPGFTLRVKPDRRRVQLPMPPGLDRRRPR